MSKSVNNNVSNIGKEDNMRKFFRKKCIIYFLMLFFISSVLLKAEDQSYLKDSNVMIRMSDGIQLATDVYKPTKGEKFPVILIRTPYD